MQARNNQRPTSVGPNSPKHTNFTPSFNPAVLHHAKSKPTSPTNWIKAAGHWLDIVGTAFTHPAASDAGREPWLEGIMECPEQLRVRCTDHEAFIPCSPQLPFATDSSRAQSSLLDINPTHQSPNELCCAQSGASFFFENWESSSFSLSLSLFTLQCSLPPPTSARLGLQFLPSNQPANEWINRSISSAGFLSAPSLVLSVEPCGVDSVAAPLSLGLGLTRPPPGAQPQGPPRRAGHALLASHCTEPPAPYSALKVKVSFLRSFPSLSSLHSEQWGPWRPSSRTMHSCNLPARDSFPHASIFIAFSQYVSLSLQLVVLGVAVTQFRCTLVIMMVTCLHEIVRHFTTCACCTFACYLLSHTRASATRFVILYSGMYFMNFRSPWSPRCSGQNGAVRIKLLSLDNVRLDRAHARILLYWPNVMNLRGSFRWPWHFTLGLAFGE